LPPSFPAFPALRWLHFARTLDADIRSRYDMKSAISSIETTMPMPALMALRLAPVFFHGSLCFLQCTEAGAL
jgi:hypothetical protein